MPRPIGFSTGSLALDDFRGALAAMAASTATAVELSALREPELEPLLTALPSLEADLRKYTHISIHAPSALRSLSERDLVERLKPIARAGRSIIVHADIIQQPGIWRPLGRAVLIENMDRRKDTGRTVGELRKLFNQLPQARFCLDLAHARQVDPSLCETICFFREFGMRISQIHLSELSTDSRHESLSFSAVAALRAVMSELGPEVPIILEFKSDPHLLNSHIQLVESVLRPSLRIARAAI